jgi:hypothetical protein
MSLIAWDVLWLVDRMSLIAYKLALPTSKMEHTDKHHNNFVDRLSHVPGMSCDSLIA